jgi:hypothetical protein
MLPSNFHVICPPVKRYSQPFQKQLASEIDELPESSALLTAMQDYIELRDQLRDCSGHENTVLEHASQNRKNRMLRLAEEP